MEGEYLYIDHQSLAPLVHALEDVLDYQQRTMDQPYSKHQLRRPLYQEFLAILNTVFIENRGEVKFEGVKWEYQSHLLAEIEDNEVKCSSRKRDREDADQEQRQRFSSFRVRTRGRRRLEMEIELIQWMLGCDKNAFQKREVVEKYNELCGGGRKQLSTSRLLSIMEKYKLWNVIIRDKHGQQHFLAFDPNTSLPTLVKREEFSKQISRIMQDPEDLRQGGPWPSVLRDLRDPIGVERGGATDPLGLGQGGELAGEARDEF